MRIEKEEEHYRKYSSYINEMKKMEATKFLEAVFEALPIGRENAITRSQVTRRIRNATPEAVRQKLLAMKYWTCCHSENADDGRGMVHWRTANHF